MSWKFFNIESKENEQSKGVSWLDKIKTTLNTDVKDIFKRSIDSKSWIQNLQDRLKNTKKELSDKLTRIFYGSSKIDQDFLEKIEEVLLSSDVGVVTTDKICEYLQNKAKELRFLPNEVLPFFKDYLTDLLQNNTSSLNILQDKLNIILMVGVNGSGKTTTIGKLAYLFNQSGYKVIIAAADTFRAAAIEQLEVWADRSNSDFVHHKEGSDPAAVVYDAIQAAKSRKANILLIDTAGRLHNKTNLMEELRKIRKIIDREASDANIESLLVLDATTGQNGLKQAEIFKEVTNLTGLIVTKLDGTAKGGIIFSIGDILNIPIKLIGVGEKIEDLQEFNAEIFINALFADIE